MPTYDYVCRHCEHTFEQFQSITAGPLRKCPACGRMKLKRLIGPGAGVIFKGSGFYETDYRSPSYEKQAKAEREGGGGESKSGTEGADSSSHAKSGGDAAGGASADTGPAKSQSTGADGGKSSQAGAGGKAGGGDA